MKSPLKIVMPISDARKNKIRLEIAISNIPGIQI